MTAAYEYAEGGEISRELVLSRLIDRWGVRAVLGRDVLGAGEARRMLAAERVVAAYEDRKRSVNWAVWSMEHPGEAELLNQCISADCADAPQ